MQAFFFSIFSFFFFFFFFPSLSLDQRKYDHKKQQ